MNGFGLQSSRNTSKNVKWVLFTQETIIPTLTIDIPCSFHFNIWIYALWEASKLTHQLLGFLKQKKLIYSPDTFVL